MTPAAIQEQIDAIRQVTAKALQSKQLAQEILKEIGVLKNKKPGRKKKK